jgi:type IV fimbrial biogenesis protein FimT
MMIAGQVKKSYGFTLIELLVSLAVLVIIVTIAVPSYRGMVERERGVAAANSVLGAVRYARSFAITSRVDGVLVQLGDDQGWPVTVVDPREDPPNEIFLRSRGHGSVSLAWASDGEVEFGLLGRSPGADSICVSVNEVVVFEVQVDSSGQSRIRSERDGEGLADC